MEGDGLILDTSAYSSFLRGNGEIRKYLQSAERIFVNAVILGELLAGFIMGKSEEKNRTLLQDFLSSPRVEILDIDQETAERYAVIIGYLRRRGTPIPTNDLWIAASAMRYGLRVLTTDGHFLKVPHILTVYCEAGREL